MKPSAQDMVREFHEVFRHPVPDELTTVDPETADLRIELIREEFEEFVQGILGDPEAQVHISTGPRGSSDIIEIADALADMIYVIYGAAIVHGIDLDVVVAEVHRSNMSKLGEDGKPLRREDGKTLKGPGYFPPNIAAALGYPKEDPDAPGE